VSGCAKKKERSTFDGRSALHVDRNVSAQISCADVTSRQLRFIKNDGVGGRIRCLDPSRLAHFAFTVVLLGINWRIAHRFVLSRILRSRPWRRRIGSRSRLAKAWQKVRIAHENSPLLCLVSLHKTQMSGCRRYARGESPDGRIDCQRFPTLALLHQEAGVPALRSTPHSASAITEP
jgi:hypothetical protein